MRYWVWVLVAPVCWAQVDLGRGIFRIYCAPCHGIRAQGGRGPDLTRGTFASGDSDADLFRTIAGGVAGTDMTGFAGTLGDDGIRSVIAFIRSVNRHEESAASGDAARGASLYRGKGQCGQCHRVGAEGGRVGPDLTRVGRQRSLAYLRESVVNPDADLTPGYSTVTVVIRGGGKITGVERAYDNFNVRLVDAAGKAYAFRRDAVASVTREVRSLMPAYGKVFSEGELDDLVAYLASLRGEASTFPGRAPVAENRIAREQDDPATWRTYGKNYAGWRYSALGQINVGNVRRLAPAWVFQTGSSGRIEASPLVYGGALYFTGSSNHAWAVDARTGRRLWHYSKAVPKGLNMCCGEVNRGFAALGDVLFKVNIEDTLAALDAASGAVLWETEIADYRKGFTGTVAPLVVKDKVLVGTAGAEFGTRGFIDAYEAGTGKRAWRFYTVPAAGEPGGESWGGESWKRGGGSTWITGTYDPELNLVYWGTGNPGPDMNGDERPGDNLYTCSIVAVDADTGKLRWHYQATPHDVHDWDAISDPVLVDVNREGRRVKAVVQANRNGFFYALDRTNGKLLAARAYTKVSWAEGIGEDGRPKLIAGQDPTEEGTKACPGLGGGHNWEATAYSPQTGLYYFGTTDGCHIYYKTTQSYIEGQWFQLSTVDDVRREPTTGAVVAVDPATGETRWRYEMVRTPSGGLLATAGGLVFVGDGDGYLIALDARSGKVAWKFQTGGGIAGPVVAYAIEGREYIAVAAGGSMMAFALLPPSSVSTPAASVHR